MAAPKKDPAQPKEILKRELSAISLHGAPAMSFCGKPIDKTINNQKNGFRDLKMYLTEYGYVLSMQGKQGVIPDAAVAFAMFKEPLIEE